MTRSVVSNGISTVWLRNVSSQKKSCSLTWIWPRTRRPRTRQSRTQQPCTRRPRTAAGGDVEIGERSTAPGRVQCARAVGGPLRRTLTRILSGRERLLIMLEYSSGLFRSSKSKASFLPSRNVPCAHEPHGKARQLAAGKDMEKATEATTERL